MKDNYHPEFQAPPELDESDFQRLLEFANKEPDDCEEELRDSLAKIARLAMHSQKRDSGKSVERARKEWSAAILALFQLISASNNPTFATLVRRNLEGKACQNIIDTLRKHIADIEAFVPPELTSKSLEPRTSTTLAEVGVMVSGPAAVDFEKPFWTDKEHDVASRPSTPFTQAQLQISARFLPRPGLASLGFLEGWEDRNCMLSYDPQCPNLLLYIPAESDEGLPEHVYRAREANGVLLTALGDAHAKSSPMLKQIRKNADETSFVVVFDLLLRILDTTNLEAYLKAMIKDTGVDSRIAGNLAKQYAHDC